jgi:hypothetical protein
MSSVLLATLIRLFSKPNIKSNIKCQILKDAEKASWDGTCPMERRIMVTKKERKDTTNDEIYLTFLLVNYFMTRLLANCSCFTRSHIHSIPLALLFWFCAITCVSAVSVNYPTGCCCFLAVSTLYYSTVRAAPIPAGVLWCICLNIAFWLFHCWRSLYFCFYLTVQPT